MPVRELGLGEGKDHSSLDDLLRLIEAFHFVPQAPRDHPTEDLGEPGGAALTGEITRAR